MTSVQHWQWKIQREAADLDAVPVEIPPAEAQQWCGFVLWHADDLPAGCELVRSTLRKEAPPGRTGDAEGRTPWSEANPAAYRTEIAGPGRRLRIKQFLYDWAFPAADHPCLWGSEVEHAEIGDDRVVWVGVDYLGNRAASARMAGTTVELSVLEGEFENRELVALYTALRPADASVVDAVVRTPFSQRSYWARHPADMVSVPTGFFVFHRRGREHEGDWLPTEDLAAALVQQGIPGAIGPFTADSAAVMRDAQGRAEWEVCYRSDIAGGSELRLIVQRITEGRLVFPPQREKHPCRVETLEAAGHTVHLGYVDSSVGPFDAQWRNEAAGVEAKLLSSAGVGLDKELFLSCLRTSVGGVKLTSARTYL